MMNVNVFRKFKIKLQSQFSFFIFRFGEISWITNMRKISLNKI